MQKKKKTQKYVTHTKKNQAIVFQGPQILDLANNDIKAVNINMFKELKRTMLKELKENMIIMTPQVENLNK